MRRALVVVAGVLLVVNWGLLLAPHQLGGRVSYVVVAGNSMEPGLGPGDFLILAPSHGYLPGDVVAYRNPDLGQVVVHRVVREEPSGYVLQGDHNSWEDSYRPTEGEILGNLRLKFAGVGRPLAWLAVPEGVSALAGAMTFVALVLWLRPRGRAPAARARA